MSDPRSEREPVQNPYAVAVAAMIWSSFFALIGVWWAVALLDLGFAIVLFILGMRWRADHIGRDAS